MSTAIVRFCDACKSEGATAHEVTLQRRARSIDLCPPCETLLVAPLVSLLDEHGVDVDDKGQPVVRRKRAASSSEPATRDYGPDGEYACDVPDCGRVFTRQQGLGMHKVRAHGIYSESSKAAGRRVSK
jgi:uncharacterized C2H2 Zn-finger protein